jgi:hypothetical protein
MNGPPTNELVLPKSQSDCERHAGHTTDDKHSDFQRAICLNRFVLQHRRRQAEESITNSERADDKKQVSSLSIM